MGEFTEQGRGGPKDKTAAKAYYERAAALGDENAKKALKRMECPYAIKDKRGNLVTNLCFDRRNGSFAASPMMVSTSVIRTRVRAVGMNLFVGHIGLLVREKARIDPNSGFEWNSSARCRLIRTGRSSELRS